MRRDASTRPNRSINNFVPRGKLSRSRTPRPPSVDYWQDRQWSRREPSDIDGTPGGLSSGYRDNQSPVESHLLRSKTDCVEGDFVLPIEIRRDLGISAALLKLV